MQFSVLIHIFSLVVFLFCLYVLSKDDFVLLRKNISLDKVFDIAFMAAGVGLLSGRVFFVLFNFSPKYLNPLYFFLFPYFPGISISGGLIGAFIFLYIYSKNSKIFFFRIFDFFAISFLSALPFGYLFEIFSSSIVKKQIFLIQYFQAFIFFLLFIAIFIAFKKIKFNDGGIGLYSLFFFSLFSLIFNIIKEWKKINLFSDNIILFLIFIICLFFIFQKEKIHLKARQINFKKINLTKVIFWKKR